MNSCNSCGSKICRTGSKTPDGGDCTGSNPHSIFAVVRKRRLRHLGTGQFSTSGCFSGFRSLIRLECTMFNEYGAREPA